MKHQITTDWKGGIHFDANFGEHTISMDAPEQFGGNNTGPSPKKLMLSALAGCTGMDVASILKKMRVEIESLKINIDATITEEDPKHYTDFHMIFNFKGNNLPIAKLEKAISLSQEQYCGVSYMYKQFAKVSWEIKLL